MGLRSGEFWELTPADFYRMLEGFQRNQRSANLLLRDFIGIYVDAHRKEGTASVDVTDYWALPGDKPKKRTRQAKQTQWTEADKARVLNQTNG